MAPTAASHGRSHSLLLAQRLLSSRDGTSPLTLILDTLEQGAAPLLGEFIARAKGGRIKTVFVAFATVRKPRDVDVLVQPRGKALALLRSEIASHCPSPSAAAVKNGASQRALIIIDSLNWLATRHPASTAAFLSSITAPAASVVAIYHTDVPLVLDKTFNEYEPHPLTVLHQLATAIFRVSSLHQAVERRRAQNRSLQEPEWGLKEGREGVLIGISTKEHGDAAKGIVFEMEMRRRSGRAVVEKFVLGHTVGENGTTAISLLSDHPMFASPSDPEVSSPAGKSHGEDMETTFNLSLTDKERKDREGVVLPYFDAQTDVGGGEGGRILYEMGREDDFDDEEDEI